MLLKAINPIGAFFQTCKVLWHLDAFRRSFRQLQGHDCGGLDCIFCALKVSLNASYPRNINTALACQGLRKRERERGREKEKSSTAYMKPRNWRLKLLESHRIDDRYVLQSTGFTAERME